LSDQIHFVALLKTGDSGAYDKLIEDYQHMVYNTVLGIVNHLHDAEDITQNVFIQIFKSIHDFKGDSKLSTWIYRIAITKSLEWERKKKSKRSINYFKNLIGISTESTEMSAFHHPGVELLNKEVAAMLFKAIKKLPENQRLAFVLIKVEGLNYQEVGEIMNKSTKSIEGLVLRAKAQLKLILNDYFSE